MVRTSPVCSFRTGTAHRVSLMRFHSIRMLPGGGPGIILAGLRRSVESCNPVAIKRLDKGLLCVTAAKSLNHEESAAITLTLHHDDGEGGRGSYMWSLSINPHH